MLLVGLTGGIGAGKSTVAGLMAQRGAVVIDADDLARRAVEPGTHGYAEVIRTFGPEVVSITGALDRTRLADRVFGDPEARRKLEAIVHPEVARLFAEALGEYRDTRRVVVYVVPLLVESSLKAMFDVIVVVSASEDVRLDRLGADRGMSPDAARARIRAQLSDLEREEAADVVIRNDRSLFELEREIDELWTKLEKRASASRA